MYVHTSMTVFLILFFNFSPYLLSSLFCILPKTKDLSKDMHIRLTGLRFSLRRPQSVAPAEDLEEKKHCGPSSSAVGKVGEKHN